LITTASKHTTFFARVISPTDDNTRATQHQQGKPQRSTSATELKRKMRVVRIFDNATDIISQHNQLGIHKALTASERMLKAVKRAGILHKGTRSRYPCGIVGIEYANVV
jgi:hypothetical protein